MSPTFLKWSFTAISLFLANLSALCPPALNFPGTCECVFSNGTIAFPFSNAIMASLASTTTSPYVSYVSSISLSMSSWNFFSHRYVLVLIGTGGSMLHTLVSLFPSFDAMFPAKTASPFSGVFLNSFRCCIIFSSASMTFCWVVLLLMFVAVPCSCCSCVITLFRSYPAGTYTVTNSVWRALYSSSSFTNFFMWYFSLSVSAMVFSL